MPEITVVDGHVHVYEDFDVCTLLTAAWTNLESEAARRGYEDRFRAVLLLAESANCAWFETRSRGLDRPAPDGRANEPAGGRGWTLHRIAGDPGTLRALDARGREVLIVAGYQVVTREGLEVLALASRERPPDGEPAAATLGRCRGRAILALPWGVGKWWGRRGRAIRRLLDSGEAGRLFLADNAGRPAWWPRGTLFAAADARDIRVISGSDPLPLPGEERTVGRAGFVIPGDLPMTTPSDALRAAVERAQAGIEAFGPRERSARFVRNQIRLRWRRLRGR